MIHLQNVEKSYPSEGGPVPILRVSDLQIAAGEQVALVGASGSGKTTLLNLLSGLVRADRGKVEVAGHDLAQLSEAASDRFRAEHVGYMFQSFHLLDGFTAVENVALGESFAGRKSNQQEARDLLSSLGLGHRVNYQPSQLSVGQQARVAIARALAGRPQVLLADEPTGALDEPTADAILELILERARELDATLVIATHSSAVAQAFDRVIRVEEINEVAGASQEPSA